jgi:hypothetical protein
VFPNSLLDQGLNEKPIFPPTPPNYIGKRNKAVLKQFEICAT